MRQLVRQNARFFFLATLAALALRLIFLLRFPAVAADSLIYGDIAKNWLQHGIYGITTPHGVDPTAWLQMREIDAFAAMRRGVHADDTVDTENRYSGPWGP